MGATSTFATFAAPTSGTAATLTVSVTTGQKLLVMLSANCENTNAGKGCFMSFDASSTGAAGNTNTPGNTTSVGNDGTFTGK